MKNTIFILSIILCLSCQNRKNKKTEFNTKKTNNLATSSINKVIDSLYNIGVFNGFSATIVDSTGVVYNNGFGYSDVATKKKYTENTIINIASVSKVFIGVALLKAQEMNFIDLDDPINKYLPFKVINPNYPNEIITIRQLATHTSSIVDRDIYMQTCYVNQDDIPLTENLKERYSLYYQNPSTDWMPLNEYLRKILKQDDEFYNTSTYAKRKPGVIYEYSNVGAALCALVIEYAAKKPFYEFTKEHIFQPLKMEATSWLFEEVNINNYSKLYTEDQVLPYYKTLSYPDGGLITSSTDLSKFLIDLIKGYSGNGNILKQNSYKELFKPQLERKSFSETKNKGFNLGVFLELEADYNVIGHTGGDPGTNIYMYFNTETKKGRILITNTDSQKENANEVFHGIWNALDKY
jgi:CubicO group peptidase (beta-lactamase class C family)